MGVDVVVFRPGGGEDLAEPSDVIAQGRLGNAAMMGHVHSWAQSALPATAKLRGLFENGMHGGSRVQPEDLRQLAQELVIAANEPDSDVQAFATILLDLVRAAISADTTVEFT